VTEEILRYTAFPAGDPGGNPAGVVLDAHGMTAADMQVVAADVGFSETAFLFPSSRRRDLGDGVTEARVRYFSPVAEVPFCGHATIAAAVAHAERQGVGRLDLLTASGRVPVRTRLDDGQVVATLTSVDPSITPLGEGVLARTLAALRWSYEVLDDSHPPYVAFAGNHHPVLAVRSRQVLAELDYDYAALAAVMTKHDWTTIQLVHPESPDLFHSRNPFPPGGVVEDPATGAAAAALGGYLRALDLVPLSRRLMIRQGDDMGRPSLLQVDIPETGGIDVTGSAARL
jgi:PhzF family phenazine biosynthesis protein